jgi:hypothetical protein
MEHYAKKMLRGDDGFEIVTLEVKRVAVTNAISREVLSRPDAQAYVDMVTNAMRRKLGQMIDLSGHEPYGDLETSEHEDHLSDAVMIRWVQPVVERTDGVWPSLHQAMRENEADLREALESPNP